MVNALPSFSHRGNPLLIYGRGVLAQVPQYVPPNQPVLVLTGRHFASCPQWDSLEASLLTRCGHVIRETITGEPSPEVVDALTKLAQDSQVAAVVAVGGGSVLDAGKAVAAMVLHPEGVQNYLEGVGTLQPTEKTLPLIAVPTTAGTGSEATKNAVVSQVGTSGFKKSLRHDAYVPPVAILDPDLAISTPSGITISCALDALSQLLEAFTSTKATPMSDAAARQGLHHFAVGSRLFQKNLFGSDEEVNLRGELSLAAYCSGLALANAGLGTVHGMAGVLGGLQSIPHGTACGLLVAPVFQKIIQSLNRCEDGATLVMNQNTLLERLQDVMRLVFQDTKSYQSTHFHHFEEQLHQWSQTLPGLRHYGFDEEQLKQVAKDSGNKNSPVSFDEAMRFEILCSVLKK
ncbi:MAG: iron-containing alcohol dehydrogenase [Spirochaetales bacterium]|nr:iron-containing alcohol dehydrogenase [Spirochaetales bacterium]